LSCRILESSDDGLVLEAVVDINEVDPRPGEPAQPGVVAASTTAKVPLGEPVSLISIQSQDGLRRYQVKVAAGREVE
jgi:hypothetical protein